MFSCKICKIFKEIYFQEQTASISGYQKFWELAETLLKLGQKINFACSLEATLWATGSNGAWYVGFLNLKS